MVTNGLALAHLRGGGFERIDFGGVGGGFVPQYPPDGRKGFW